jgi:hypothetical protein
MDARIHERDVLDPPAREDRAEPAPPVDAQRTLPAADTLNPAAVLALQRTAGNSAVAQLLSRQSTLARDDKPSVDKRLEALEKDAAVEKKKTAANTLDLKWRGTFGKRLSGYREVIYGLTGGFQSAVKNFDAAQAAQAQAEALKDQVMGAIINVAAAGTAEALLTATLGGLLKGNLDKWIELAENPLLAAGQGAVSTAQAKSGQTNAAQGASGGKDPLLFMASNLKLLEAQTGKVEQAFIDRSTRTAAFTPDEWIAWDLSGEETRFADALKAVDALLLADPSKLESEDTLAAKIEIYYWSAWIKSNYIPGVKGLQVGAKLATRMKALGIESLADVRFDTTSWIFMNHQPAPPEFEQRMGKFAKEWSQPLVKK